MVLGLSISAAALNAPFEVCHEDICRLHATIQAMQPCQPPAARDLAHKKASLIFLVIAVQARAPFY